MPSINDKTSIRRSELGSVPSKYTLYQALNIRCNTGPAGPGCARWNSLLQLPRKRCSNIKRVRTKSLWNTGGGVQAMNTLTDSREPACAPGYASLCDAEASTLSSGFDIHKVYDVPLTSPPPPSDCPASRVKHLAAVADNNLAHPRWGSVGESQVRATDSGSTRADVFRRRFLRSLSFVYP